MDDTNVGATTSTLGFVSSRARNITIGAVCIVIIIIIWYFVGAPVQGYWVEDKITADKEIGQLSLYLGPGGVGSVIEADGNVSALKWSRGLFSDRCGGRRGQLSIRTDDENMKCDVDVSMNTMSTSFFGKKIVFHRSGLLGSISEHVSARDA